MGPIGVGGGADPAEADAATAGCADEGGGNNGGGGKRQGLDGAGPSMERHLSGTLGDEGEAAHGGQKALVRSATAVGAPSRARPHLARPASFRQGG